MSESGLATAPAVSEAPATGAAPAAEAGRAAPEWLATLPETLRGAAPLAKFSDPAALAKSYVELEGLVGRKGVIPPTEKDGPEVMARFRAALGVPETPDGYALAPPEGTEATWSDETAKAFGGIAHEAGLTPAQARKVTDWWAKSVAERAGATAAAHAEGQTALRGEWGPQFDGKLEAARRAVASFGGEDLRAYLDDSGLGNNVALIKAFAAIGEKMGEDRPAGMGTSRSASSPNEAAAEIASITGDLKGPYWDRQHPQHRATVDRVTNLYKVRAGEA